MTKFRDQVLSAVRGRHPLIVVRTPEEDRVAEALKELAPQAFPGGTFSTWSCVRGLEPAAKGDTHEPLAALQDLIAHPRKGFVLMEDLSAFLGDPRVVRALREAYFAYGADYKSALVLAAPTDSLPEALEKEVCRVELEPPTSGDFLTLMTSIQKQYPKVQLGSAQAAQVSLAMQGLTVKEAEHVLHRAFSNGAAKGELLAAIFEEKETLAKRAGYLEFIPVPYDVARVGGLENLKDWAAQRKNLFNQESVSAGIPVPKGVLIMGVSGCGKSMIAKAISGLWKVPLFRLDMSLVFSGAYGSPEAAFHRALKTIESVAPVVLWIDEMESALSAPKDSATPQALAFSAFLTWMQEKPPLVFVAATANRIESLPAEIIRKGRFDQVFFCDLPGAEEREEILSIHLRNNGANPGDFDMSRLVYRTKGWSGAEIEQAVIAARVEAHQADRPMVFDDLAKQCDAFVPLSKTMAAQVKAIRDWAHNRATRASRYPSDLQQD